MSEQEPNPEKDLDTQVKFGAIVRCRNYHPKGFVMITDLHPTSGVALIDRVNGVCGMPGTIIPGNIMEIVDTVPFNEATEMIARAFSRGELQTAWLNQIRGYYAMYQQD